MANRGNIRQARAAKASKKNRHHLSLRKGGVPAALPWNFPLTLGEGGESCPTCGGKQVVWCLHTNKKEGTQRILRACSNNHRWETRLNGAGGQSNA